jgi:hypothetical protein
MRVGQSRIRMRVSEQFVHLQRDFAKYRDRITNAGKRVEDYCGIYLIPNAPGKTYT